MGRRYSRGQSKEAFKFPIRDLAGIRPYRRGQKGEIIAGDIIVAMDNKLITTLDEFLEVLEQHNAGDTIVVTVLCTGATVELPVRLGAAA